MDSFKIANKDAFIELIDVSENELKEIIKNKQKSYHECIVLKKKRDSIRTIFALDQKSDLFKIQRALQRKFFCNFYFPSNVYGFIKQRNYIDYLVPHCSQNGVKNFLRLDIKDFFGTIDINHIKECLKYYIDETCDGNEKKYIIDSIAEIVTYENKLIQGAITSPVISNLVFRKIDIRIERFCEKNNVIYTRYADDMLFSGMDFDVHKRTFINMIATIIKDYGFSLNYKKTIKMHEELSINGYVLGREIKISRKKYKPVNCLLYYIDSKINKVPISRSFKYQLINILAGYRSLFIQVLRYVHDSHNKEVIQRKITEIEKGIDKISQFKENNIGANKDVENEILKEICSKK